MTEDQLEPEALAWLVDVGSTHRHGPDLAPEGRTPERADYRQVLLLQRLRNAIDALNPKVPRQREKTPLAQVLDLSSPVLLGGPPAVPPAARERRAGAAPDRR